MAPKQHESSELVMMPRPMDPSKENWEKIIDQGMDIIATGISMRQDDKEQHITMPMLVNLWSIIP